MCSSLLPSTSRQLRWRLDQTITSLVLLTAVLVAAMNVANAEIYRWVDTDGKVHYTDQPGPVQDNAHQTIKLHDNVIESSTRNKGDDGAATAVMLYSTTWCGYCKKARRLFQSRGVAFTEVDIEKNRQAKRDYDKLGGRGVPFITIGDASVAGYNVSLINRLLDEANL